MHGFEPNYVPGTSGFEFLASRNFSIIEEYVDPISYNVWVTPGEMVLGKTGAGLAALDSVISVPAFSFPTGTDDEVHFSFRRPRQWQNGRVSARVYYEAQGIPTIAIVGLSLFAIDENGTLPAHSYTGFGVAGGGAGQIFIDRTFETSPTTGHQLYVDQTTMLIGVGFQVEGSHVDHTLTNPFNLVGLEVFYRETDHAENHVAIDPDYRHVARR